MKVGRGEREDGRGESEEEGGWGGEILLYFLPCAMVADHRLSQLNIHEPCCFFLQCDLVLPCAVFSSLFTVHRLSQLNSHAVAVCTVILSLVLYFPRCALSTDHQLSQINSHAVSVCTVILSLVLYFPRCALSTDHQLSQLNSHEPCCCFLH
jgi:hypothetical protein